MRCLSDHSWVVWVIRVCRMWLFLVSNWNCFKRVSLIGNFNSTKSTWQLKLFSVNSGLKWLKWDLLRVSQTNIFPGWILNLKACKSQNYWDGLLFCQWVTFFKVCRARNELPMGCQFSLSTASTLILFLKKIKFS